MIECYTKRAKESNIKKSQFDSFDVIVQYDFEQQCLTATLLLSWALKWFFSANVRVYDIKDDLLNDRLHQIKLTAIECYKKSQ